MKKPYLHVAVGDPGGIGPKALIAALKKSSKNAFVKLYGPSRHLNRLAALEGLDLPPVTPPEGLQEPDAFVHEPSLAGGGWALACLGSAVHACRPGDVLLTLPVHKGAIAQVQPGFRGQTEWLRQVYPERTLFMGYRAPEAGPDLLLLTEHGSLASSLRSIAAMDLDVWWQSLLQYWTTHMGPMPSCAFMGINPHAGEDGLMGVDEQVWLEPFIKRQGLLGPWAPDTTLQRAQQEDIGLVVAPLHDLGLGPWKAVFPNLLHLTLGLPFLRVSPSHGVAFSAAAGDTAMNVKPIVAAFQFALQRLEVRPSE